MAEEVCSQAREVRTTGREVLRGRRGLYWTGAPLTGQTDCSCNVYAHGGHLLCHDDVIGTRCVSYILYLSRPGKQWLPRLGGALELYATDAAAGAGCAAASSGANAHLGGARRWRPRLLGT